VRTKFGTIEVESKLSAISQFSRPIKANRSEVRKANVIVRPICANERCVKNIATASTIDPVIIPRITPPVMNPDIITQYGVGETRISSIVFWNFAI
jgi:hypothetical protein